MLSHHFAGSKWQGLLCRVYAVSHQITKLAAVIENEIKPDLKTLYEVQVQTNEHLERHDGRFDVLETKVDALSTKTLRHSFEISALKRREDRTR